MPSSLLLEDGSYLLQQDLFTILLEDSAPISGKLDEIVIVKQQDSITVTVQADIDG